MRSDPASAVRRPTTEDGKRRASCTRMSLLQAQNHDVQWRGARRAAAILAMRTRLNANRYHTVGLAWRQRLAAGTRSLFVDACLRVCFGAGGGHPAAGRSSMQWCDAVTVMRLMHFDTVDLERMVIARMHCKPTHARACACLGYSGALACQPSCRCAGILLRLHLEQQGAQRLSVHCLALDHRHCQRSGPGYA